MWAHYVRRRLQEQFIAVFIISFYFLDFQLVIMDKLPDDPKTLGLGLLAGT
jgi:hypothetical protein